MPLTAIYANLACSDLDRSTHWFTKLFGRAPDASPMDGLREWHHGKAAGFQLHSGEGGASPGSGALTLIVSDLKAERDRIADLDPPGIEAADAASLLRLRDPDGNLVVLVELA